MKCWWRGKNPLNSTSYSTIIIRCPWVSSTLWSFCLSKIDNIEEVEKRKSTLIRSIRTNYIPPLESIRIIQITTWHTCLPKEVLWHKCYIHSQKELKKVSLSMMFRILNTCKFTNPKIKCSKNTCNCTHTL
jgi:hypothetical protein